MKTPLEVAATPKMRGFIATGLTMLEEAMADKDRFAADMAALHLNQLLMINQAMLRKD